MSISWSCHDNLQDILNLESEWRSLHRNCNDASFYNGFDFVFQSIKHFQIPNVTPFILTIRLDNELIGLFYLQSDLEYRMGLKVRVLEFCALEEIDKPYPLIHINHIDRAWSGLFQFLDEKNNWDILSLIEQKEVHLLALKKMVSKQGLIHRINPDKQGPLLNLDQPWEAFWDNHKKMRKKLYKIEKDFKEKVSFKIKGGIELLDDYLEIEQASWKQNKLGVSKNSSTLDFYKEMAYSTPNQFFIGILYLDGEAVSGEIAYTHNGKVYFCQGCYKESFKKYSPGMISTSLFLKHFITQPEYTSGDFLCGYAGYLNAWSDDIIKTQRIDIYRPNWVTKLFFTLRLINKITPSFVKRFAKEAHALLKTNS